MIILLAVMLLRKGGPRTFCNWKLVWFLNALSQLITDYFNIFTHTISVTLLSAAWCQLRVKHFDATNLKTLFSLRLLIQLYFVDSQLILVLPHHFLRREARHCGLIEYGRNRIYSLTTLEQARLLLTWLKGRLRDALVRGFESNLCSWLYIQVGDHMLSSAITEIYDLIFDLRQVFYFRAHHICLIFRRNRIVLPYSNKAWLHLLTVFVHQSGVIVMGLGR